jgi:hypothetical protein
MKARYVATILCAVVALVVILATATSLTGIGEGRNSIISSSHRIAPDRFRIDKLTPSGERSGARVGDVLDSRALTVEQRMSFWNGAAPPGAMLSVPLFRGGSSVVARARVPQSDPQTRAVTYVWFALMCLGALAGLLLMMRGEGIASFAAGLMLLTLGFARTHDSIIPWSGPPWLNLAIFELLLWSAPAFAISAFVLGRILLRDRVSRSVRTLLTLCAAVAIGAETMVWTLDYGQWMFTGHTFGGQLIYPYAAVAWIAVTIATFALAAARSQGPNAAAVRILFVATAIGLGEIAYSFLSDFGWLPRPPALVSAVCQLLLFSGYFYAFFARRLVSIDFVINRAAVFAIVAAVIAGVLALVEKLIETLALGRESSFALEVGATLVVALSFRWLERRISAAVERIFYRDRLRAAEALEALSEDFPLLREQTALANHIVREVQRQMAVPSAVLYLARSREYVAEGAAGVDLIALPPVSDEDPAIVRLRSRHRPVDCHEFQTHLGSAGFAFPLAVLGRVTGCLYVAARTNGEVFDPDERALLTHLAREAAVAMVWMLEHQTATPALEALPIARKPGE